MTRTRLACLAIAALVSAFSAAPACAVTDDDVTKAIEKGREYLIGRQLPSGLWPEEEQGKAPAAWGSSEIAFFTLCYLGEHPNRPYMRRGAEAMIPRKLGDTRAVGLHAMALAVRYSKVLGDEREQVGTAIKADVAWLVAAQGLHGGWGTKGLGGSSGTPDFTSTLVALQALRDARRMGIESPEAVWQRAQRFCLERQQPDGGWNSGEPGAPSCGSMTAAGVASLFLTFEASQPAVPCPRHGEAPAKTREVEQRMDAGLAWLSREFTLDADPRAPASDVAHKLFWLYAAESAAVPLGCKYFGARDWYKEGAEYLVKSQAADGSWGDLPSTCFAMLFLAEGRRHVWFSKLRFDGQWNSHPLDLYYFATYLSRYTCGSLLGWRVATLQETVEELHDTPILYISVQSPPAFREEEMRRLWAFADTGGTICIMAPRDNAATQKWIADMAAKLWPEWPLKRLAADHAVFNCRDPVKNPPEIFGIDDGLRTFLFSAPEEIACSWQTRRVYPDKMDFRNWGDNLVNYATDSMLMRPRLNVAKERPDRYASPVTAGGRTALTVARLKYDGPGWAAGRNYRGFEQIVAAVRKRAGVALKVLDDGVAAGNLGDADAAYVAASPGMALGEAERAALKRYVAGGGLLWIEAVGGKPEAGAAARTLAAEAGWTIAPLTKDHGLLCGKFEKAAGYNLTSGVEFRYMFRMQRFDKNFAELFGIFQDGKLIGVYSPFDVVFSSTEYQAYGCKGYRCEDALALATNLVLFLSERPAPK